MNQYPMLEIDVQAVYQNACILRALCLEKGVCPTAVVKGYNNIDSITDAIVRAGFHRLGSSRLSHLKAVKEKGYAVETLALRIPMLSEAEAVIRYCDISLNSERLTLEALDQEARRQGKRHKVILMRDVGDLREGIFDSAELVNTAVYVEKQLDHLTLFGIGVNLTCFGSVIPTPKNLSMLVEDAVQIEARIGRKLDVVSGGSTSSLPLVIKGGLPDGINDLRIGEALVVPCDLLGYWNCNVPGLSNECLILKAEIIEIGEKPTRPVGEQGANGFGSYRQYEDRGKRLRALLALGVFDIGDYNMLIPADPGIAVLGGSSDHLIVDIGDSQQNYKLGGEVAFQLSYKSMLFATGNPFVKKIAKG